MKSCPLQIIEVVLINKAFGVVVVCLGIGTIDGQVEFLDNNDKNLSLTT